MKTSKQKSNRHKNRIDFAGFFMMAIPLLLAGAVACFYWFATQGLVPIPGLKWNDEAAYYQLIKTCVTTGQPVGYWGFNGNHALVGTGSAWSPAILWPYAIWAFIFPLSKGFVYFVNLFYITIANLVFYFCVKPDKKQSFKLALAQATSAVFILYLSVNMSEMFRYALAIVIAGLLYRILFKESAKVLRYVITPIVIVGAVQVYVFFAFCVPIYVFAIMKKSKLWKKLLVSAGAMGVVAGGSYYLLHLISSNYNIHKTERLLNAVKAMDILGAVKAFLGMMKQGMIDVFHLWTYVYTNPLIPYFVLFAIMLVVVSLFLFARKNSKKDKAIGLICAYSIVIFFWMYLTLYSIDPFTFMRGTYIAVIFSMYFLAMTEKKWLYPVILALQAVSLLWLPVNMDYYMTGHYISVEEEKQWDALETAVGNVIIMDESKDIWGNTVAMYTMEPKAVCAMPAGIGVNFIMQDGILPKEAGYLFFSTVPAAEQNSEWIVRDYETFVKEFGAELESDYQVIYQDEGYIIYEKK